MYIEIDYQFRLGGLMTNTEKQLFGDYIKSTGLRETTQRSVVLEAFLATMDHVSVEDMFRILKDDNQKVGYATVYRTMKLIAECGLAREVMFNDGIIRFEHTLGRSHHHHLICTDCGKVIEFESKTLDVGEEEVLKEYGFKHISHHFKIFGLCRKCQKKTVND